MEIISGNLRHADRFFDERRDTVEWARPHAGCTGFPKLLQGPFAEDLAARLASEEGVMLLPGEVYGYPGHFRLGFGRRDFPEALEKLERFFERRMRTGGGV
jgi:aspartate/methionine/tyrosine aminotransferase